MRILKREEARKVDVDYIYKKGDAIAIVDFEFNEKYEIITK